MIDLNEAIVKILLAIVAIFLMAGSAELAEYLQGGKIHPSAGAVIGFAWCGALLCWLKVVK